MAEKIVSTDIGKVDDASKHAHVCPTHASVEFAPDNHA